MKLVKLLTSSLILPSAFLPSMVLSSCNNNSSGYIISHTGSFDSTIEDCEAGNTYTASFNFTTNKTVDLDKYQLTCNSSSWKSSYSTISYFWSSPSSSSLTLKISIKLKSSFTTQEVISCDNLIVNILEKSTQKTVSSFTFDALKIILNEKITGESCTVTFVTNGGTKVSSQTVKAGKTATKPSSPTKDDYSFVNWYRNGSVFDFSTKITSDITLSAYWTEADPYDYIHNRSFSLSCWGLDEEDPRYYDIGWGTSWILSDATPNDTTDFTYWIATNWHVVDGQDQVESAVQSMSVGYADDKSSSGISPVEGYTEFDSYTFEGYDKFYFNKSSKSAIDFVVAKADFNSASTSVKTKLNKLNYQQKTQGYINKFVNTTSSTHYESNTVYTGGFPVQNSQYATWEYHSLPANVLEFYSSYSHKVDSKETISDDSYQYISKNDYGSSWMIGGASGSMLISKINNEWSPIGIYWGGFSDYSETQFYPSYSIFKSDKKDFIANYV